MNSDTSEAGPSVWGAGTEPSTPWSTNRILAAVGIAAVLAGAGAVAIHAAGGGSAGPEGPGGGHGAGPGWGPPPGGFHGGGAGPMGDGPVVAGMGNALHGEFVVPDGHGAYRTQLTQTGTVTAISDTSITARSDDGYSQTYVITTDTRRGDDPVKNGDIATIRAVENNGANTATVISPSR
jgi:hypothetical protein